MSKQKQILVSTIVLVISLVTVLTAKGQTPTGADIARITKSMKLDPQNSTTAERDGMKVTVTPTDLASVKPAQLEKGYVIAVIDVIGGPEAGNGRHNLFVARFKGSWRAFLESNGKVKELKNVEITQTKHSERKSLPPQVVLKPPCWHLTPCWGSGLHAYCLYNRECYSNK